MGSGFDVFHSISLSDARTLFFWFEQQSTSQMARIDISDFYNGPNLNLQSLLLTTENTSNWLQFSEESTIGSGFTAKPITCQAQRQCRSAKLGSMVFDWILLNVDSHYFLQPMSTEEHLLTRHVESFKNIKGSDN